MSYSKQTTIWCDGDECGEWDLASMTAAALRRDLKRNGWTHKKGKDLCPKCSTGKKSTEDDRSRCHKCGQSLFDDQPESQGDLCARCYMRME